MNEKKFEKLTKIRNKVIKLEKELEKLGLLDISYELYKPEKMLSDEIYKLFMEVKNYENN